MRKLSSVKVHPAADIFPWMDDASFQLLKDDISKHGQRELVMLYRGELIDGRNRVAACEELGIDWDAGEIVEDDGPVDPYEYVLSINLHRRHLTTSQRSLVAARMATLKDGQKKADEGRSNDLAQADAAKLLSVSTPSVKRAKQVIDKGSKAVVAAVDAGTIPVSLAAKLVNEVDDKNEQTRLAKAGAKAIREYITPQGDSPEPEPEPPAETVADAGELFEVWREQQERLTALRAIILDLQPHEKAIVMGWMSS